MSNLSPACGLTFLYAPLLLELLKVAFQQCQAQHSCHCFAALLLQAWLDSTFDQAGGADLSTSWWKLQFLLVVFPRTQVSEALSMSTKL
jgi:hypothetical protein